MKNCGHYNLPKIDLVATPIFTPTLSPITTTPLATSTGAQGTTVEIKTLRADTPANITPTGEGVSNPQSTEAKVPIVLEVAKVSTDIDTKLVTLVRNDVTVSVEKPVATTQGDTATATQATMAGEGAIVTTEGVTKEEEDRATTTINARVDNVNANSAFIIPPSTVKQAGIADNSQVVEVKMANGAALPQWLKVDPVSMAVQLDNPPANATENGGAQVRITLKEPNGAVKNLVIKVTEASQI